MIPPCPFCGSEKLHVNDHTISCTECSAQSSIKVWARRNFDYADWSSTRIAYLTKRCVELSRELYDLKGPEGDEG